jgi:tetratricopeptide (TPR) repeat protein
MDSIAWPDQHHLRAAEGWLELGNAAEARVELERVSESMQAHPMVLELRWQVNAASKDWATCLDLATLMTHEVPNQVSGWIHRSYSLHEMRRTREAWDNLMGVVSRFPENATVAYNLACYACQLGDLPRAQEWLDKAFALDKTGELQRMSAEDPDLIPLLRPESKS